MDRAKKVIRLRYWGPAAKDDAHITFLEDPGELRLGVGGKSFFSVKEDQITLSGGTPSVFNIQGMSSSMKYAGMIQDLPFPLSIMPTTPYNPFPKQIMIPPMVNLIETMGQCADLCSTLLGA